MRREKKTKLMNVQRKDLFVDNATLAKKKMRVAPLIFDTLCAVGVITSRWSTYHDAQHSTD